MESEVSQEVGQQGQEGQPHNPVENLYAKKGRPTLYTPEIASVICEGLTTGKSLRQVCRASGMPHESTVRKWDMDDVEGFHTQYARARSIGLDVLAEYGVQIAGDKKRDPNCRRVELDAIKWFTSKLRPDKYGDRSTVSLTGADGGPVEVNMKLAQIADESLLQAIALLTPKPEAEEKPDEPKA